MKKDSSLKKAKSKELKEEKKEPKIDEPIEENAPKEGTLTSLSFI